MNNDHTMQYTKGYPKLNSGLKGAATPAEREKSRIILFRNLLLIGMSLSTFGLFYFLLYGGPLSYLTPTLLVFFTSLLILSYYKRHRLSRLFLIAGLPLIMSSSLLVYGADGGAGYTLLIGFSIAIVFQDELRIRIGFVLYNMLLYGLAYTLLIIIEPPLAQQTGPMEATLTYLGTAICVTVLAIYFVREIAQYEQNREQMLHALDKKNKALEQTQQEIERFTRITSHDLKSPVRTISSFLDLMKRDLERKDYERLPEYITFAKRGAYQLNLLINDIMEYTELNDNQWLTPKPVKINKLIENCSTQLARAHERRLLVTYPLPLPRIMTIERELSVVFLNLMENALIYNTNKQPEVIITHQEEEEAHLICFKDNGIGISREFHQRVFDMFQRLHTDEFHPGTGLGLALCRKILQRMNGDIWLKSSEGAGSSFFIRLPKVHEQPFSSQPAAAASDDQPTLIPAAR